MGEEKDGEEEGKEKEEEGDRIRGRRWSPHWLGCTLGDKQLAYDNAIFYTCYVLWF